MKKAITALVGLTFSVQLLAAGSTVLNGKEIKSQQDLENLMAKELKFS